MTTLKYIIRPQQSADLIRNMATELLKQNRKCGQDFTIEQGGSLRLSIETLSRTTMILNSTSRRTFVTVFHDTKPPSIFEVTNKAKGEVRLIFHSN